jgi:hypothetical protein
MKRSIIAVAIAGLVCAATPSATLGDSKMSFDPTGTRNVTPYEQLALEKAVRLGLTMCLINLIVEHATVVGGDQTQTLSDIKAALKSTAESLNLEARNPAGGKVEISSQIRENVSRLIDLAINDAQKRMSKSANP